MLGAISKQEFVAFERGVKQSFAKMKEELTEHLECINDNTSEVQTCIEYMNEVDGKINKLNEKMERILLLLEGKTAQEQIQVQPLSLREQEIFVVLYTNTAEQPVTYQHIVRRTGLPLDMVKSLAQSLIAKGVPIMKRYVNQEVALSLDPEFKEVQAKTNLLALNEQIVKHLTVSEQSYL